MLNLTAELATRPDFRQAAFFIAGRAWCLSVLNAAVCPARLANARVEGIQKIINHLSIISGNSPSVASQIATDADQAGSRKVISIPENLTNLERYGFLGCHWALSVAHYFQATTQRDRDPYARLAHHYAFQMIPQMLQVRRAPPSVFGKLVKLVENIEDPDRSEVINAKYSR